MSHDIPGGAAGLRDHLAHPRPRLRNPAVKVSEAGLRLMLNTNHTDDNIERFLDTMTTIRARHQS
ncbi:hypothetical protein [Nocardia sp. NPDC057227]|uniref:hypothetical protein n=1 Tax=Nocardia sp. NPDC057227 TaxID=3346056 RepID=UPI0036288798